MEEQLVWVPSTTDAYELGKIVDIRADSAIVQTIEGNLKVTVPYDSLLRAESPTNPDVDDNCSLLFLNEASLLSNVRRRYFADKIYTYVGNILVAVNPYKQIGKFYDVECIRSYNDKSLGRMPPHVFAIADNAHRSLKVQRASQAIIVSGESGAGKTECTKHILRYLTENWGTRAGPVEQRILDSNPLLEAFGNAKTRRNNNSSRFGKFIELHFSASNQVAGAHISHYLLEKSRVCLQNADERNYHIFYQICAGITDQQTRRDYALGDPSEFAYLRKGCSKFFRRSSTSVGLPYLRDDLLDDGADFARTIKAMSEMGLANDQQNIIRILSAILHLGNVEFVENDRDTKGGCVVDEKTSGQSIAVASNFLGIEKSALCLALTTRVMMGQEGAKGTCCSVQLSSSAARNARDALAKSIYSRLFDFVVAAVNTSLPFDQHSASQFIGVLDIAGFEFFDVNSFEQFCVNYCNERLQQFFTQRVLKAEQELYEREGLVFRRIQFVDNEDCIELLDAKPSAGIASGIFCLLDEESKFPRPSSQHFTQEVHRIHNGHFRLCIPRKSKLKSHKEVRDEEGFVIRHYAGAVCYITDGFLEKNNDALHASLEALVQSSSNALLCRLFTESQDAVHAVASSTKTRQGGSGAAPNKLSFVSISAKFREQLQVLIAKLQATGTHFIRCVKPNSAMAPRHFEASSVLSQLQAGGMTEALRLMQQGFPSRVNFNDFYSLYKSMLPASLAKLDPRLFCRALCKAVGMAESDFTFGATKVFFRSGRFAEFDQVVRSDGENLRILINSVRQWILRARWRKAQYYIFSAVKVRRRMAYRSEQAIIIQKNARGLLARQRYRPQIVGGRGLKALRQRLVQDVAKSVDKLKDDLRKKTDDEFRVLLKSLDENIAKFHATQSKFDRKQVEAIVIEKTNDLEKFIKNVESRLSAQNARDAELERLRKLEAEMAEAKRIREAEEAEVRLREERQRAEEEEARRIAIASAERQKEEQARFRSLGLNAIETEDAKLAISLQEQIDREDEQVFKQKIVQEKLDRNLALRLANGNQDDTVSVTGDDFPPRMEKPLLPVGQPKKHDVTNWKYADLRDTINTSCDIELIDECRQEFHRRLRIYHEWKMRNRAREETAPTTVQERMPGSVMNHALKQEQLKKELQSIVDGAESEKKQPPINFVAPVPLKIVAPISNSARGATEAFNKQRFFRLPLKQLGPRGTSYTAGWWLAHFDGQWIARQLEIRDGSHPILKVAGVDDMSMCEFNLSETGLEGRPDAEISEHQFEYEWNRNYGLEYLMANAGTVSSPFLKSRLQQMVQKPMTPGSGHFNI